MVLFWSNMATQYQHRMVELPNLRSQVKTVDHPYDQVTNRRATIHTEHQQAVGHIRLIEWHALSRVLVRVERPAAPLLKHLQVGLEPLAP
jgi:hypothetical protein